MRGSVALLPSPETNEFSLSVCVQSCSKADVARISDPIAATSYLKKTNNSPQIVHYFETFEYLN